MQKRNLITFMFVVMIFSTMTIIKTSTILAASDDFRAVSAGAQHNLAIKEDGSLWTWGDNHYGQLGDGTKTGNTIPTKILSDVESVAAGSYHSLAVTSDGTLWAWGENKKGQVGDGTITTGSMFVYNDNNKLTPVVIMDNVHAIAAGAANSFAIKNDKSLWAWGNGNPIPIRIMEDVAYISAGSSHNLAIKTDSSLWAWGSNQNGELGDGTTQSSSEPIKIMDNIKSIAAGDHFSLAVKTDGSLWAWGYRFKGQLGDGKLIFWSVGDPAVEAGDKYSVVPIKIMDDVVSISAGATHSLAIKSDGSLWAWGSNKEGEIGAGTSITAQNYDDQYKPTPIKVMDDVAVASAGKSHSLAIKTDGSLWAWGRNIRGLLGDGTSENRNEPTLIAFKADSQVESYADLQAATAVRITLDGRTVISDQSPIIENGRTLVPIRVIAESLGADVDWDQNSKTVTLVRADKTVKLAIGSNVAQINGKSTNLDVAPIVVNDRTLLPLRFVTEAFSQNVEWDEKQRIVRISEDMSFSRDSNLEKWLLGVGAIIAQANSEMGMEPYVIGMMSRTPEHIQSIRKTLSSSWGTTDRNSLLDTIDSIANYGHSYNFDYDSALFKSLTSTERNEILKNAQGMDKYMWEYIMSLDKKWGEKSIRAWDWFRVGHLCRWGYLAGYITLEEAYILFEPTAKNLRATFSSWEEANDNYLDGYAYWGRININEEKNDYAKRKKIYENLQINEKNDSRGLLFDPTVWNEPVKL